MARKMEKEINGTVVSINVFGGSRGKQDFDYNSLPETIKDKLGPFGLNHKLGDSGAGKTGPEAEEAVLKVWEGLQNGEWTVREPAAPKVPVKTVMANLEALPEEQKAAAYATLQALGLGHLIPAAPAQ